MGDLCRCSLAPSGIAVRCALSLGGIILDRDQKPLQRSRTRSLFVLLGLMRLYRILWALKS